MADPARSNPSPLSPQTIRQTREFLRRTSQDRLNQPAPQAPSVRPPQRKNSGVLQGLRKLTRPLTSAVSLNALQASDRRQAQDQSPGLTDAYEEMMSGVGGTKRGGDGSPRKSYTTTNDGEAEREMERQRAMTERAEQFVSPEAATGEEGEAPARPSSTEQTAETEGAEQGTRGPEAQQMAQAQTLTLARAEDERQQALRRGAFLRQAMQRKQSLEAARKKKSKIIRKIFRQLTSVVIPVIGFVVALNIEFIHDRIKPLIPNLPQERSGSRMLVTVAADGCLCCCCFLQAAFPLIVAGGILLSLNPF